MKKKGGYLYYIAGSDAPGIGGLYRVKLSSGKKQRLDKNCPENYVIKGNKLYFDYYYSEDSDKTVTKVMKLNGKSKKVTNVKIHMKSKESNAKKYRTVYKGKDETTYEYLKTPRGSIFLSKSEGD